LTKSQLGGILCKRYHFFRKFTEKMTMPSKNQRMTISDVAKSAGVSIATVSRVLNQTGSVSPDTVTAVQAAIDSLGYQPNRAARALAAQKNHVIGVLVDEITGDYSLPLIRGIELQTSGAGYEFMMSSTRRRLINSPYLVNENNTDGLIVFANSVPERELERLVKLNFPVVLLACTSPQHLSIPYVTVENETGAFEMVHYLIETRNYRKFAFLRGPAAHEDTLWRERGYRQALANHGLNYEEQIIGDGGFNEDVSYETVIQWTRRGVMMDVIVAFDDDSAIGAMAALRDANIKVPDEIAVVGFDDIRLARFLTPPLTTVRIPIEHAAKIAIDKLIELIETEESPKSLILPTELIIRRSCGCC
jgi:DNA-binding LacI/PurR family transcriptional regulator